MIPGFQLLDCAVELLGDAAEGVAILDGVVGNAVDAVCAGDGGNLGKVYFRASVVDELVGSVGVDRVLLLQERGGLLLRQAEGVRCASGEYVAGVLGVEASQFGEGDIQFVRHLLEVHASRGDNGVGEHDFVQGCGADTVLVMVVHRIVGGNEDGQVGAGLAGEVGVD